MPKPAFQQTLVHELTHAWTNEFGLGDKAMIEGFCNYVAYLYLVHVRDHIQAETAEAIRRIARMEANSDERYGVNFRHIRDQLAAAPNTASAGSPRTVEAGFILDVGLSPPGCYRTGRRTFTIARVAIPAGTGILRLGRSAEAGIAVVAPRPTDPGVSSGGERNCAQGRISGDSRTWQRAADRLWPGSAACFSS